jgi:hypothetical protein
MDVPLVVNFKKIQRIIPSRTLFAMATPQKYFLLENLKSQS